MRTIRLLLTALVLGCGGGSADTITTVADGGSSADGTMCLPTSCAELGHECGAASDGCGGALACGGCSAELTCGGGGAPNVCAPVTVALDVKTVHVSGVVTANGQIAGRA